MPLPEIPSFSSRASKRSSVAGAENLPNPFGGDSSGSSGMKIALRTEEEQQAAAREREEQQRAAMAKEIQDRREARRKSLANRRVSFAAEATLHTFQEVEYMQDSTTSTDHTRRASSVAAQSPAPPQADQADEETLDAPSADTEHVDETVAESPEDQRQLHRKSRRRSSLAISENNFGDQPDDDMASTVYDSDSDEGDDVAEVQTEASGSDSDSDNDGTLMTVDAEEMTSASLASTRYGADDGETSSSLDGALREAARRAVNQAREPDEDEEIIPGFMGWGKSARQRQQQLESASQEEPPSEGDLPSSSPLKSSPLKEVVDDTEAGMAMDLTAVQGGIIEPEAPSSPADDMSMDVTNAYGGILASHSPGQPTYADSAQGDATMEFTTAVGDIHRDEPSDADLDHQSDQEMSMELTSVMGRVLGAKNKQLQDFMQQSSSPVKDPIGADDGPMDMTLDMTSEVGRILAPGTQTEEQNAAGDDDMDMEITAAVGDIIKSAGFSENRTAAKRVMELEADQPETTNAESTPIKSPARKLMSSARRSSETSPGLAASPGKSLRRSKGSSLSTTPQLPPASASTTPLAQRRTRSQGPASPSGSPTRSTSRTPSPQRRTLPSRSASPQTKATTPRSSNSSMKKSRSLFQQDSTLPLVVLTPQRPKLSGVGIDRSGIGSPRVTEIMDRRGSIGDSAATFSPIPIPGQRKAVAFMNPRLMSEEVDRERRDDEDRENRRSIMEQEADGGSDDRDATLNLRELIQELSPKKMPFKGRKSLHVGSARGVLGKRPTELDEDSDAEEQDGVKRLKGLQGSPVKNIRLQQPPSKAETTGSRATRSRSGDPEGDTSTPTSSQSPQKHASVMTPKDQDRFRNVSDDQPTNTINFNATPSTHIADLQPSDDGRIHLQHFLNMTSIRFMELTTTKRRHTVMPSARKGSLSGNGKEDVSFEKCVVAGACTIPMLELFQHSCHELKKYISEGRRIVREIETETFLENPPLFQEYITATSEFKALMDNQFKNVKTHAKLLSKAGWYEWRMKLQQGLMEGLIKTAEGMAADEKSLDKQQRLISSVLPAMTKDFEALSRECENLEIVASELEDCDPEELNSARSDLVAVEDDIEVKTRKLAELREQLQETEQSIDQLSEQKKNCQADIKEAEKVREDCRGWSSIEISALKAKVDALEEQHGWAISAVQGSGVSMTYRRKIELVFDTTSFKAGHVNSRIDLRYIETTRDHNPLTITPEREFCLQSIRDYIRGLPQSQTKISRVLRVVSAAWNRADALANQVHQLNLTFPTLVIRTSDSSLAVKSSLLLVPLQTKVEVVMIIQSSAGANGLDFVVSSQAGIVYGEKFNAGKMAEFLSTRVGEHVFARCEKDTDLWCDVVSNLHGRLLAQGSK
ncbi:unnamed protein product [Discula destructiva]